MLVWAMASNSPIEGIDLSPAAWQATYPSSTGHGGSSAGLVMPPPDTRFILAQLVAIPASQNARMPAYKRFVNAPTSLTPATNALHQHVTLHEIRLADVAWDYERGRPMHPMALRVCTNERIVGRGIGGTSAPDQSVCTCEEGTCCGMPKEDDSRQQVATNSSCCESGHLLPATQPASVHGVASKEGPLPRYECATGTCAPLPSVGDSFEAPRLPSCCGGSGDGESQGIAPTTSSNPRTWANRVLVGYLRLASTTHTDSTAPIQIASTSVCRDHHIQLDFEPGGPEMSVPGLIPHIFTVIATHISRGGDSAGVLSSIKRSLKQQRPTSIDDRIFFAVRKQELALRVAIKRMGSLWAVLPAAATEEADEAARHVVYVAKLTDLLSSNVNEV